MDRIKSIAYKILDELDVNFSSDFITNKQVLDDLVTIQSKQLRNEIAGFITKIKKNELSEAVSDVSHDANSSTILA